MAWTDSSALLSLPFVPALVLARTACTRSCRRGIPASAGTSAALLAPAAIASTLAVIAASAARSATACPAVHFHGGTLL